MPEFAVLPLLLVPAVALVAGGVLIAITVLWPLPRRIAHMSDDILTAPRTFLFRDGYLVECDGGGFFLPSPINNLTAWSDLRNALGELIPGADDAMDRLESRGVPFHVDGGFGQDRLYVIGLRDGPEMRITVASASEGNATVRVDIASLNTLEQEMSLLRHSQKISPLLAWVTDEDGKIVWANGRYRAELSATLGEEAADAWPLPVLFPEDEAQQHGPVRRSLGGTGAPERWFEVTSGPVQDGLRHVHAQPLGRLIEAETSLRTFLQTLTRTFSALPTGLAIFDRDLRAVMFNPQLLDMTGLDGAWLSARPHLTDVLDQLRENQRLPEPRNWKAWRSAVIDTASDETGRPWRESWTLPDGRSFRMTARPQAGGVVAILLEDVSAEMALARQRRSDEGVLTALLEESDDAFAAFGARGEALHLNAHMRELTGFGPDATPDRDAFLSRWARLCRPSPLWGEVRNLAHDRTQAASWSESVSLADGTSLEIRVVPLPEGRLAVRVHGDLAAAQAAMRPIVDHEGHDGQPNGKASPAAIFVAPGLSGQGRTDLPRPKSISGLAADIVASVTDERSATGDDTEDRQREAIV
ncbi:PAS-domain containing protein [Jannaschia aquimarina]|uniref:DivL protein n=1 Tax=Jannaschia aquimarina TaxID=935700 RepID=A0A0D1EEX4_9RHOB|nr:PAS-domain containing protein [Jannaschia aquimarina]KIT15446.1 Sensor protein DivL [Jannaschia aquimarina]SNT22257.1 PAS fold [Jannaschia aquimarina]